MSGRRCATTLIATAIAAAPAAAQNPAARDIVARAVTAMGGADALRGINTVTWEYHNATFGLGQSELPESPPRATVTYGRARHDYRGGRRAVQQETRQLTGAVVRQRSAATSTLGMNEGNGQQAAMAPGGIAGQMRLMRMQPERLMLSVLDDPSLAALPARMLRGLPYDGVRMAGTDTVSIWFDRGTGLPLVVESVTDDPILGDRVTQTWLTRWQPAGNIRLPRQIDAIVNGQLSQHVYMTAITVNTPLPDSVFAIHDSIARRAQALPTPPPFTLTLNQLAPFVWRAESGNYRSLIVEQEGQVVIVEAPVSTEFSRAVLDSAAARFPGKRVGMVVMTHHHWDHTGGLREYIGANIPVVTLVDNESFVRQVAAARRTLRPDLQSQRRRNPQVRTFTDTMVIGQGDARVVLYRHPTLHAEGLLSAWVPAAGVLFTSDVLNPTATLAPVGAAELVALARARNLRPDKYAGGHGQVVNWADVERAAAPTP